MLAHYQIVITFAENFRKYGYCKYKETFSYKHPQP